MSNITSAKPIPQKQTSSQRHSALFLALLSLFTVAVCLFLLRDILFPPTWPSSSLPIHFSALSSSLIPDLLSSPFPPTVLLFYSYSCPACARIRRPFTDVAHAFPDIKFIAISLDDPSDDERGLGKSLGVTHIPSIFWVKKTEDIKSVKYNGDAHEGRLAAFINDRIKEERKLAGDTVQEAMHDEL